MAEEVQTLNELFNFAVEKYREQEFLRFKRNDEWRSLNYGEAARRARELALGLCALGLKRGERAAIWSENRPEWNLADVACLAIGAVDVPIYTTQARPQVEFILSDSGARVIFVSSTFLREALELKERVPSLEWVVLFDDVADESLSGFVKVEEIVNRGRALYGEEPDLFDSLWKAAKADDLATLLYTSGTTGEPKGVMLTHKNLTANCLNSCRWLKLMGRNDLALTYLPFSHIFERAVWYVYAYTGAVIAYAESIETVAKNLQEIRPTAMTSVPRMFEKIYARIMERGLSAPFPRKQIFLWAMNVGRRWAELKDKGEPIGALLSFEHRIADKLVFKKWREAVGGRIRNFISGGAPLAPEIAYMFLAAGLPILEGYGLTETSPSISCNTESHNRIGTVGRVMEGVSVKIAEDGEILVKGDTVMRGYYNRPDANQEAFTEDGWFRTGDIGHVDKAGFLVITDRKKELIKTSGGKYVAPQRIESLIKSSRFVSQVIVIGDKRNFVSALIYPNMDLLRDYAKLKGIDVSNDREMISHPRVVDLMQRQVDKYTAELARFEKVKKVALLEQEMTIESGELTPTLKPRRNVIEQKHKQIIDGLYKDQNSQAVAV